MKDNRNSGNKRKTKQPRSSGNHKGNQCFVRFGLDGKNGINAGHR